MGKDEWEAVEGGFVHGIDLVSHIHEQYGDYFCIVVAGFPQHMLLPPDQLEFEMKCLREKIAVGVDLIFTQMFYDVELFIQWVKAVRAAGITIPIVPGIAPLQTWNGFMRATSLAKTVIPKDWMEVLEPHKNNDEKVRALGTKLVAEMCRRILREDLGIKGLHFYTMNLEKATKMLLEELNFVPRVETIKPLPWRQVSDSSSYLYTEMLTLLQRVSPLPGVPKQSGQSSGPTGRSLILPVPKIGTNTPMVVSETPAVLPLVNSMAMAFGSSRRYLAFWFVSNNYSDCIHCRKRKP